MFLTNSSIFIFRIYIYFILIFLIMISFFLSKEIYNILDKYFIFFLSYSRISTINVYILINYFLKDKQFFIAISLLELCIDKELEDIVLSFIQIGSCYNISDYFKIAKYYYKQALSFDPHNPNLLKLLYDLDN
uniref:Uncharacterized protein n=1 Tax=Anotrichium furcellatum TaxID=41999 RepID=A0A4D6WLE5_9FLOR|nr:hypothetical protein [Anotrichium furcellatum]